MAAQESWREARRGRRGTAAVERRRWVEAGDDIIIFSLLQRLFLLFLSLRPLLLAKAYNYYIKP
jgi:hypothetical protein